MNKTVERGVRRLLNWLVLGNLAIALLLGALLFLSLLAARDSALERGQHNAEKLVTSLQLSIQSEVDQADIVLRNVASHIRTAGEFSKLPAADLNNWLHEQQALVSYIDSLRLTDANGRVTYEAEASGGIGTALGDRAYFQTARDQTDNRLVVSEPVLGRIDHKWVVALARRIESADGRFLGIVHANISVDHFAALLASVKLSPGDAATLRSTSMTLVARHVPGDATPAATGSQRVSSQLANAIKNNPREGAYLAVTALDGIKRTTAYRQIGAYPFVLLVGLDVSSVLLPWQSQVIESSILFCLVVAIMAVSSWWVYVAWCKQLRQTQAVKRLNRRHEAIMRTASDGMHVIDRSGRVVELSDSFAQMLGEKPTDMLGRHVTTWDAGLSAHNISTWLKEFGPTQRSRVQTRYRRSDGSEIDVEIMFAGAPIDGQNLIYCSARDVTQRKQLEVQLAAAAEETRDLYDQAPCGYHSLDAQGVIVQINATELEWLGVKREDVVGKLRMSDFFTDEGRSHYQANFSRLLTEGFLEGLEFDLVSRHGAVRRVSVSATAVRDSHGEFVKSRSVMYDITALKEAQDQLQALARAQRAMLDNDLIGMVKLRDRTIVWKNQAMDRIFGYERNELIGRSTRILFTNETSYVKESAEAYSKLATGERFRHQLAMRRKDGSEIWVDSNGVMLSPTKQESLWMTVDITALKNAHAMAERLAFHDALTGLPNRLLLMDRLKQAIAHAQRQTVSMAVCYLDLDGFKSVNDRFGHAAGDELLKEVASRVRSAVRANDTVCRLGGDEFVILMTQVQDEDECHATLSRVSELIRSPIKLGAETKGAAVTASIGVAMFPGDGSDAGVLMERADQSMYHSKRTGKSKVSFFQQTRDDLASPDALPASA